MPTDLDDIFASVAREADLIPLSTAAQARKRGRQRTRNGIIATAAAVCVVLAGVGVAAGQGQRRADKTVAPTPSPSVTATTPTAVGPLPPVGKPITYGRTLDETHPTIVKDRIYDAWKVGEQIAVVAADLRTGEVIWRIQGFSTGPELGAFVSATEDAVLVGNGGGSNWVLDPADGSQMWTYTSSHLGEELVHERVFVQRNDRTGQVDAHDLRTGRKLWSIAPSSDMVDQILGMRVYGQELPGSPLTDDRLVVVRRSGQVQVRDIVSGDVKRTTTPVSPPNGGPEGKVAYEGKFYDGGPGCCDTEPYRVVVTDLTTGASKKIFIGKLGHTVGSMTVCGANRVCLVDEVSDTEAWLRAVDANTGQVIWSVPGPVGGSSLVAYDVELLLGGDGVTRLIDGNGREVFRTTTQAEVEWLDGGRVLVMPPTTGGEVQIVNTTYGTVTRLGLLPARAGTCAHTPDRLVCPTTKDVRVFQLRE
ncbi:PQQ-binding-like beta-propeller repeat protein [Actinoplanes sp. LDG1-06]|uniref:PQQ-binding-like beta-propeller repeat protein n=1 Tax=Paractinoplanes ovalisporus TaxID=2810368 RepID=A0ABS2AED3_9ACTN|nr:PQQ-binding-like beta-propeller repeat protein [Actinoplanes ovalisporus]MBM2617599.1 PQQ-binding-like beta-propeller repeat protein [Actinoplanes ovalisporus]